MIHRLTANKALEGTGNSRAIFSRQFKSALHCFIHNIAVFVSRPLSSPFCSKIMEIEIRQYEANDEEHVVQLWTDCGLVVPWNNPHRDIQRKLDVQPELFMVGCLAEKIIATVMAGYDGHRGWINYLAVHPDHHNVVQ